MRMSGICLIFIFAASCSAVVADDTTVSTVCGDFNSVGLTEGKPIVMVSFDLSEELAQTLVEPCVVVTYRRPPIFSST